VTSRAFHHQYRVTYADCTLGNHVYYSRYLDILEAARGEFFRQLGQTFLHWQERDTIFPVIDCRLRYKGAARYDDLLGIDLWLTALEKIQFRVAYRISFPADQLLVEASTQHVCTSIANRLKRIPEELAAALSPFVIPATDKSVSSDFMDRKSRRV
jgi:acyl-CoA thioester hydrolase